MNESRPKRDRLRSHVDVVVNPHAGTPQNTNPSAFCQNGRMVASVGFVVRPPEVVFEFLERQAEVFQLLSQKGLGRPDHSNRCNHGVRRPHG